MTICTHQRGNMLETAVTTHINQLRQTPGGKVWQRGYYERIIRNEREWRATQQ